MICYKYNLFFVVYVLVITGLFCIIYLTKKTTITKTQFLLIAGVIFYLIFCNIFCFICVLIVEPIFPDFSITLLFSFYLVTALLIGYFCIRQAFYYNSTNPEFITNYKNFIELMGGQQKTKLF